VQTVTQQVTVLAGFLGQAIADCPAGYTVTGGGFQGSPDLVLTSSTPLLDHRVDPPVQAWSIVTKDTNATLDLDETAYAVCVK
jgi:hypothetical protein